MPCVAFGQLMLTPGSDMFPVVSDGNGFTIFQVVPALVVWSNFPLWPAAIHPSVALTNWIFPSIAASLEPSGLV